MSPREKKLLIFFGIAGFIILNFLGFKFYTGKKLEVHGKRLAAEASLERANLIRDSRDQVLDQVDWIADHEPKPTASQDALSSLQQLIEREAQITGLSIKPNSQKLLPTDETPGRHYHRVKVQITVTGSEQALYTWFDHLNVPEQFRAATNIRLAADREDDSKIDCTAIIEQWFVPIAP